MSPSRLPGETGGDIVLPFYHHLRAADKREHPYKVKSTNFIASQHSDVLPSPLPLKLNT